MQDTIDAGNESVIILCYENSRHSSVNDYSKNDSGFCVGISPSFLIDTNIQHLYS